MSNPRTTLPTSLPRPEPPKSSPWLMVGVVAACAIISGTTIGGLLYFGAGKSAPLPSTPQAEPQASTPNPKEPDQPKAEPETTPPVEDASPIVDDDGKTLWVSPTNGKPLDLAYLSPGAQIILSLHPAALLKNAEGEKIRTPLGPSGQQAIESLEKTTTIPLNDMDQLLVGCQATSEGKWITTMVVRTLQPFTKESLSAKLRDAPKKDYNEKKYALTDDLAYFLPGGAGSKVLVVGPEDAIHDVIDLAGQTPPLRRDIERLIAQTDSDRQLTIVFAPNSLFSDGQSIFSGPMSRIRDPLFWFLGDELSGAALSLNWDTNFFLELIATPTLETSPEKAARIFAERVSQIPDKLEQYVVNLNAQPYGRLVLARFPEMVRKLTAYTRSGFDTDHAVLRCYLPAIAGHNLLLAAELTLAETPGAAASPAASASKPAADNTKPATSTGVKDQLAKVTSLKFAHDTLESALEQLSQDIGAPIVIRGPDLQADGITKNQSFGIDVSNKPAEEILVQILRLANPDKTATAANDKRQKLVYIIEQKPDKTEQIVVTTRTKAAERHDELPAAFRVEKR